MVLGCLLGIVFLVMAAPQCHSRDACMGMTCAAMAFRGSVTGSWGKLKEILTSAGISVLVTAPHSSRSLVATAELDSGEP